MNKKRIYIAGHRGMVGSALVRKLQKETQVELICKSHQELDLLQQKEVFDFLQNEKIDEIYLAAAKVGGILANNSLPGEFIYENLTMAGNIIHGAHQANINKLLFFGSSCIYPKLAAQPIEENALLSGALEPTNEAYAVAKIAGLKLCQAYKKQYGRDFRSIMPCNLYGPFDNFSENAGHVIPALMHRFHQASQTGQAELQVWGSGKPLREFLHVDDLASAAVHVMKLGAAQFQALLGAEGSHINAGSGKDISITSLAKLLAEITAFKGRIVFDSDKPDGTPKKCLDNSRISRSGWAPAFDIKGGLKSTYLWYRENMQSLRT